MKKILIPIALFFAAAFYLADLNDIAFAQEPQARAPENFREAEEIGGKALNAAENDLPGIITNIWKNDVWPVWKKMGERFKSFLEKIWQKIKNIFQKEVDTRKTLIDEEFKKEKTELKEDLKTEVPTAGKSLWEKFKEIIR